MFTVQSVRGVGCKAGYPYFATGLYRATYTRRGILVWRLERSGNWHRSTRVETCGRLDGSPVVTGVRHNQPVTAAQLAALKASA